MPPTRHPAPVAHAPHALGIPNANAWAGPVLAPSTGVEWQRIFTPDAAPHPEPEQPRSPEHRLMLAVLEQAVTAIQRGARSAVAHRREAYREALGWVTTTDHRWPVSFVAVCGYLGLDPACIRTGLARWLRSGGAAPRTYRGGAGRGRVGEKRRAKIVVRAA
jgi:hypothetical protein